MSERTLAIGCVIILHLHLIYVNSIVQNPLSISYIYTFTCINLKYSPLRPIVSRSFSRQPISILLCSRILFDVRMDEWQNDQ